MNYDREDYMRRQEAEHDMIRMRQAPRPLPQSQRAARIEAALRNLIYEVTHLCPMQPDGSHRPIISAEALEAARAALRVGGGA